MTWWIVFGVVVVMLGGYGAHRAARWAGDRGWVYNKHNPRPKGSGTLGLLEEIYQPSIEHVMEERSAERIRPDQDESGQDPSAGERP